MNNHTIDTYLEEGYRAVSGDALFGRQSVVGDGSVLFEGGYREATAAELFGSFSEVAPSGAPHPFIPEMTKEPLFHVIVLVTLVVYINMLLRSWRFISAIYGNVLSSHSEERMGSEGGVLPLQRFKQIATVIGSMALALGFVRLADGVISPNSPIYIQGLAPYATLVTLLFVVVFVAWFYSLHRVVEWVTNSDVAQSLASVGYINFVRSVVIIYPIVAVWLLAEQQVSQVVNVVVIVVAVLMLLLYLKDTFLLFIEKRVPILYWILYLCTAILLPLSFLVHLLPVRLGWLV